MSGPALKQLHSHQSIHDGYYTEGRELTEVLEKLYLDHRTDECIEIANALIEHWETRTIAHADSEEEGFYLEVMKKQPELKVQIIKLVRDHDLLRMIVTDVKERLSKDGISLEVLDRLKTILLLVNIHNREEEKHLFAYEHLHHHS